MALPRRTPIVLLTALLAAPAVVPAQGRAPGAGGAPTRAGGPARARGGRTVQDTLSLREAVEALRSPDPERVIQGVDSLTVLGTPEVIPPLVELLHAGPSDRITDYVVEKLGIIGRPEAIEELSNLLQHRRGGVRRQALRALAQIHDPRVRRLIESGLHDSDAEVRDEAARALGEIGARESVALLFRAFDRGVPEASESIGRLGAATDAVSPDAAHDRDDPHATQHHRTLAMYLGRSPLSVLLRGFERFLNRSDIPATVKEQIVVRLEQQASAQVREFLQRWVAALPAGYHGRDRARAELAIQQIRVPSGAQGGGGR